MYEVELIKLVQDTFGEIAEDCDPYVRQAVCQLIIVVCNDCDVVYHEELLQILDKVCLLHHL